MKKTMILGGWGGTLFDEYGCDCEEDFYDNYYGGTIIRSNKSSKKSEEKVIPDFKICPVESLK